VRRTPAYVLLIAAGMSLLKAQQAPVNLTLAEAERLALKVHPHLASSSFLAEAAGKVVQRYDHAGCRSASDFQPQQPLLVGYKYPANRNRFWTHKQSG
jgi:hypothetical protein